MTLKIGVESMNRLKGKAIASPRYGTSSFSRKNLFELASMAKNTWIKAALNTSILMIPPLL